MGVPASTRSLAGVAPLVRHPAWQQRAAISPSSAARLLSCQLKLAFDSEPGHGQRQGTPAALLGLVCHGVLSAAASARLGPADNEPGWRAAFEEEWGRLVDDLRDQNPLPPDRWPGFNTRKVAARRLALAVSREADSGALLLPEHPLALPGGELRGRADLIVRKPVHEVRDYKSGPVTNFDGGPREEYVRQLLLYAFMEAHEAESWPHAVVLVPFRGAAVRIEVSERRVEAEEAAREAVNALRSYNTAVEEGTDPFSVASPAPHACGYCEHAGRCGPFWANASDTWAEEGVVAAAGPLREMRAAQNGGVALEIDVVAGSLPGPRLIVTPLDPADFLGVTEIPPGALIGLTGLRMRGPGYAAPAAFTTLVWSTSA